MCVSALCNALCALYFWVFLYPNKVSMLFKDLSLDFLGNNVPNFDLS